MPLRLLLLALAATASAAAQTYEPARGTAERSEMLDAVRAATRAEHGVSGEITFFDVTLRAEGRWASFVGEPRRPNGSPLGHCRGAWGEDTDFEGDLQVNALLYRSEGTWHVVESGSCATDVWFIHWPARYGVSEAVVGLPATEPLPHETTVVQTDDGFLSLRSEPSVRTGSRILRMPSGERVRVLHCQSDLERIDGDWGRWCRVEYGRESGWAFSAYLALY